MRKGRLLSPLHLTSEERETLERWMHRRKTTQALAQRARIVLGCATGKSNLSVATVLHIAPQTVGKWRARFIAHRLEGLMSLAPVLPGRLWMPTWSA